jgi:uncharacterized protein YpiB (UPF0302 family)
LFLYFYLNLNEGDLCAVNSVCHPFHGRLLRFKQMEYFMQCPVYVFETAEQERVALTCESQFETIPFKASIHYLIDLALQTRDESWFRELVDRLKYASQ